MSRQLLLFVCCALMGLHPAAAEIVSDQVEDIDQVLILNAAKATLKPGGAAGTWQIILKPQVGNLVTSNPTVAFRTVYGKAVSDNWTGWFENKPTPAVLTWQDKQGEHGLVLEVDQPRANHGAPRFTARLASQADGTLASFSQYAGALPQPGTVKQAALYLDDTQARVIRSAKSDGVGQTINGCVIQPFTSCPGADLGDVDLAGADLRGARLESAHLDLSNLTSANLYGANLGMASLDGTVLSNAHLRNADLRDVLMDGANLTGATLSGASMDGVIFCKTIMPNGSINNRNYPP